MPTCKSILVVEDDLDLRKNLTEFLESEGYQVVSVENGQMALDKLHSFPKGDLPGCILLDLMMPVMDGLTFLNILQKNYPYHFAKIPILVATAKGGPQQMQENSLPLALAKIKKPFDIEELLQMIEKYCGKPST